MTEPDSSLKQALARRLAGRQLPDQAVTEVAKLLSKDNSLLNPLDVGICTLGICTDHIVDNKEDIIKLINLLGDQPGIGGIQIFPKGIINPNHFLVKVDHLV